MNRLRRWLWLADVILLAVLSLYIFAGRELTPFHGDESTFIWLSADYDTLVHRGDAIDLVYSAAHEGGRQFNRIMTGTVNPMTIGLAWDLAGYEVGQLNQPWIWSQSPEEWDLNVRSMTVPDDALLAVSRTPSSLFTIASLILIFLITRRVSGSRWAAWATAILVATSPGVLLNGRRAMQEGAMLFGTALIVLVALEVLRIQRQPEKRRALLAWMIALGAAIGFGLACKHTAAVVGIAALLAVLIAPLLDRDRQPASFYLTHILRVIGAGCVTVLIFYALTPLWWSPGLLLAALSLTLLVLSFAAGLSSIRLWIVRGAAMLILLAGLQARPNALQALVRIPLFMLDQRQALVDTQAAQYGAIQDAAGRLRVLAEYTFFPAIQYYEVPLWAEIDVITRQIAAYESFRPSRARALGLGPAPDRAGPGRVGRAAAPLAGGGILAAGPVVGRPGRGAAPDQPAALAALLHQPARPGRDPGRAGLGRAAELPRTDARARDAAGDARGGLTLSTLLRHPLVRYALFGAILLGAALLLLTQPPAHSPLLFALFTVLALLVAGIDRAVRAGLGPRALLRALQRRGRDALRRWRDDRRAAAAAIPTLEDTLAARLPWLQVAAEIGLIVCLTAAVTRPYLNLSPATQLPGIEAEWLTSSAHFAANSLRDYGYLPLWQPYLEFGEPLIDNPFSFVLNPISAGPSLLLGGVRGIKLSIVLSTLLAGLGGWVLGRVLGFAALGRLLLAALLIGKGNMHAMIGAGYYQLGVSQAYLPWVIAGALATLRLPARRWPVVLTALSFTLLFWAGNIWYTLPALISLGLLALAHLNRADGKGINWAGLRRLALAGALTLGLSAITLLPIWLQRGQIGSHPSDLPGGRAVDLGSVITQFFDGRLELYLQGLAPGAPHFYYSFVTPLWFALVFLILIPPVWPSLHRPNLRQGWRVWLPGATVIVLATLWGAGGNPLFAWLYEHVPLLGQWRFVGRALGAASFWIAILVVQRVDGLWRAIRFPGWQARLVGPPPLPRRGVAYVLAGLLIACSATAAQQVLVAWHTFTGTIGVNVYDEICLSWLREQHPDEELAVFRLRYDAITPFLTYHVRQANIAADFRPLPQPATLGGNFDLTVSLPEYAIAWDDLTRANLTARGYVPVPESPAPVDEYHCLWRQPDGALPYAFSLSLPALEAVTGDTLDPALVTPIETLRRYPDTIFLAVTADTAEALVVTIQERAYPGWQVTVDGAAARLESVGGQVGVQLPPDGAPHAITFAYRPPLLTLGGAITLLTWAGCVLYLLGADRFLARRVRSRR